MVKNLILLRGVSGAGKSTISTLIRLDSKDWAVKELCTDDYFYAEDKDGINKYMFDPSKLKENHEKCRTECEAYMIAQSKAQDFESIKGLKTIIISNTFTQELEMEPYFKLSFKYDWGIHTIIVENRHGSRSIHGVPDETIESQIKRFEVSL